MALFQSFYNYNHIVTFNRWPVSQLAQQLERQAKKSPLSDTLLNYIKKILTWPVMSQNKTYWGNDM